FGANGALGGAIARVLEGDGCSVSRAARTKDDNRIWIDPEADKGLAALADLPPLAAVVWAQGANVNDDPATRKDENYERVMNANVGYVRKTLEELLRRDLLAPGAALCVVSSIWQEQARAGKLSYTI